MPNREMAASQNNSDVVNLKPMAGMHAHHHGTHDEPGGKRKDE